MPEPTPALTLTDPLPHWDVEPDLYDTIYLGGQLLPGVATIKVSRKRKVDKKSAKGKDKAVVTVQGYDAAEVTIVLRMISAEDAAALHALMPLLEPTADKEKRSDKDALDISSYATSYRDIQAVIIEDLEGPELADGFFTLTMKCVEFHKTATAGKGTGGGGAVKIGTFVDFSQNVLPNSRVAYQGPPDKDAAGEPVVDAKGNPIFTWSLAAYGSETAKEGFVKASGGFTGRFIFPDTLLEQAWNKARGIKDKDVTSTPKGSKGGPSLAEFGGNDNDAPAPIEIDGEP